MQLAIRKKLSEARSEVVKSVKEDHTPHETAFSFALGAFIVLVPTSATGLLILGAIALSFDRINRIALFSTAVVFNPAVNMGFYALSYFTGSIVLGSPSVPDLSMFSLTQTVTFSQNLIVGSILTAAGISLVSYLAVHRISVHFQTS